MLEIVLNITQSRLVNVGKSTVARVMFSGHANGEPHARFAEEINLLRQVYSARPDSIKCT